MFEKLECFKIQIMKTKNYDILDIKNYESVYQILCEKVNFFAEPVMIVADPFLFVHKDRLYLFYEQKSLYHDGVIMVISTLDLENWTKPVMVLKENFHLSYPMLFEEDGYVYMIPETCGDKSIRLYESDNEELTSFHFVKKLIIQPEIENLTMSFADTSIYKKNGMYYLYTTLGVNGVNQLELYYADNILGPYTKHKASPIVTSNKYGRNAGCPFIYNGVFLRPAQDCELGYGDNVHLMKIEEITASKYREVPYKEYIIDTNLSFYKEGGHQFNIVKFKEYTILATDAKEYHQYFFNRLMHKLGRYR